MQVLVTGGSGFIGSNFVHYWLEENPNDTITNLDSMTYCANPETNKHHQEKWGDRYHFVKGDIRDASCVASVMKEKDLVVHFAAESHVDRSIDNPEVFLETNVLGTYTLLNSALEHESVRFHHVSTDEVYGSLELDEKERFHENRPYSPRSPYAASKAASDHLVSSYFHTYDLPITISNCSNNYGPYQFPEKVIPLFILRLMKDLKIPVYGDGKSVRDYLYVKDHCRAIETIIKKGRIGETYCIGGDSELNTNELAEKILDVLGKSEDLIQYTKDRSGHDRRYAIDHTKITEELGWRPTVSFEEGLEETVEWYRENEEWWEDMWDRCNEIAERYLKG